MSTHRKPSPLWKDDTDWSCASIDLGEGRTANVAECSETDEDGYSDYQYTWMAECRGVTGYGHEWDFDDAKIAAERWLEEHP